MPRAITDHHTSQGGELILETLDDPGQGGAHHAYLVSGFDCTRNPSTGKVLDLSYEVLGGRCNAVVLFQNGPVSEVGNNGITNEVLLAIVIDRLRCFQSGPFTCAENDEALRHAEASLLALQSRTLARMERGVEGTSHA